MISNTNIPAGLSQINTQLLYSAGLDRIVGYQQRATDSTWIYVHRGSDNAQLRVKKLIADEPGSSLYNIVHDTVAGEVYVLFTEHVSGENRQIFHKYSESFFFNTNSTTPDKICFKQMMFFLIYH